MPDHQQPSCESDPEDDSHSSKKIPDTASVDSGYTSQTKSSNGSDAQRNRTMNSAAKPSSPTKRPPPTASSPIKHATTNKPHKIDTTIPPSRSQPATSSNPTSPPYIPYRSQSATVAPPSSYSYGQATPVHPIHTSAEYFAQQQQQQHQEGPGYYDIAPINGQTYGQYQYPLYHHHHHHQQQQQQQQQQQPYHTSFHPMMSQMSPSHGYFDQSGTWEVAAHAQPNEYNLSQHALPRSDARPPLAHHASMPTPNPTAGLTSAQRMAQLSVEAQPKLSKTVKSRDERRRSASTAPRPNAAVIQQDTTRYRKPKSVEYNQSRDFNPDCDCPDCILTLRESYKNRRETGDRNTAERTTLSHEELEFSIPDKPSSKNLVTYGPTPSHSRRRNDHGLDSDAYITQGPYTYNNYYKSHRKPVGIPAEDTKQYRQRDRYYESRRESAEIPLEDAQQYQDHVQRRKGETPVISSIEAPRGHSRRPSRSSQPSEEAIRRRERKYLSGGIPAMSNRRNSVSSHSESQQSQSSQLLAVFDTGSLVVPADHAIARRSDGSVTIIPLSKAREKQYYTSTRSNASHPSRSGSGAPLRRSNSIRSPVIN